MCKTVFFKSFLSFALRVLSSYACLYNISMQSKFIKQLDHYRKLSVKSFFLHSFFYAVPYIESSLVLV